MPCKRFRDGSKRLYAKLPISFMSLFEIAGSYAVKASSFKSNSPV